MKKGAKGTKGANARGPKSARKARPSGNGHSSGHATSHSSGHSKGHSKGTVSKKTFKPTTKAYRKKPQPVKPVTEVESQQVELSEESESEEEILDSEDEVDLVPNEVEGSEDESESDDELEEQDWAEDEFSLHQKDLVALKEKDPSFYEFLVKNESGLLEFEGESAETETDLVDEDESEDGFSGDTREVIDLKKCQEWKRDLFKSKAIKTLYHILLAFKAASRFDQEDSVDRYQIENEKVYNAVILLALKYAPIVLQKVLYGSKQTNALPFTTKKWSRVNRLVKSFVSSLLTLQKSCSNRTMFRYFLKQGQTVAPYIASFPKIARDFFKEWINTWASATDERECVSAFMCIRKMAIVAPNPFLNRALKSTYKMILDSAKQTSTHTWPQLKFMTVSFVELCGLHLPSTYQFAYVSLRQLATHLKRAVTQMSEAAFSHVYQWPFYHAVRVWSQVLMAHSTKSNDKDSLKSLVYPLVQLSIGSLRLGSSSKFYPFRLLLVRQLIELGSSTDTYIPLASYLLDIFESAEMKCKPKPSTLKPLDFSVFLRTPKAYIGTKVYHTGLIDQVMDCLWVYFSSLGGSIAFPELVVPCIVFLRRISKHSKDSYLKQQLHQFIAKMDENARYIEMERSKLTCSPKDAQQIWKNKEEGSPLIKFNSSRVKIQLNLLKVASNVSGKKSSGHDDQDSEAESIEEDQAQEEDDEMVDDDAEMEIVSDVSGDEDAPDHVGAYELSDVESESDSDEQ